MRKNIAFVLVFTILFSTFSLKSNALSNLFTSEDPLEMPANQTYIGREQATKIIENLDFDDLSDSFWAKEAITRLGALDIVKGYNYNGQHLYKPDNSVSNQEAIAFIIRSMGLEARAQQEAIRLANNQDTPDEILDLWSRGYLVVGRQIGLITAAELADALTLDQEQLDPEYSFLRSNPATREQVAEWIIKGIQYIDNEAIDAINGQQRIYEFSDWTNIDPDKIDVVEQALVNNIMGGFPDKTFRPKGYVTRSQMAQMLKNIDDVYYGTQNIVRKTGIVVDSNEMTEYEGMKEKYHLMTKLLVEDGSIEEVVYTRESDAIGQITQKDVVVFKNGKVKGLESLEDDDYIEFLVDLDTMEMLYINNLGEIDEKKVSGILQPLTEFSDRNIVIEDDKGNKFKYKIASPLIKDNNLLIDGQFIPLSQTPVENWVELTLINGIVTEINYKGLPLVHDSIEGIVVDISPQLGYITIVTHDGDRITKHFYKKEMTVEKQQYYDDENEIGYYDEVFPDFRYDPMDTTIDHVDVGDTVTLILDPENKDNITKLSAKANLRMYYGKVEYIQSQGTHGSKVHLLIEDGTRNILNVPLETAVFKGGKQVGIKELIPGDWVKVLVNQGVIQPGQEAIKVLELVIDDLGYYVTNIYRGQISYFNKTQNQLYLQNSQTLSKLGWVDYQEQKSIILSDGVEYYHDNERVSKDYIGHFLQYSGEVYVAVEADFGQEVVKKVTVRSGKDRVMDSSNVTFSNGAGRFKVKGTRSSIYADDGTIIVRNGRLVNEQNIMVPDYAQVIMNGNRAAIVHITPPPITDNIKVYRGRIKSIDEGVSFTVQSHAELNDMQWSYSPVQSTFTIDYTTKIYNQNGIVSIKDFIDYTTQSQVNKVYTIYVKGNQAEVIVEQPYVREGIRGEIYKIDGDKVYVRDTFYYDRYNDNWRDFSAINIGAVATIPNNAVIIKNGAVVSISDLEPGDKIRVVSDENLRSKFINQGSNDINGYIVYVEG